MHKEAAMKTKDEENQDDFFPAKQQTKKGIPIGNNGKARIQSRSRR